jgi:hypothetical protein
MTSLLPLHYHLLKPDAIAVASPALTNGFSKKFLRTTGLLSRCFAYYNFCRIHNSIRVTPAMEAGITDHVWDLVELL